MYSSELRYSPEHFWVKSEDGRKVRIGITHYYLEQLKKIIFVELSKVGTAVRKSEPFGSIESSKTISDMPSPVSGKVVAVNTALQDAPDLISKEPYSAGWMVVIEIGSPEELGSLLSSKEYELMVSSS